MICSLERLSDFNLGIVSYSISSVDLIVISKIFLFAPLTISNISPLTGEQNFILSLYLSKKITVPALTLSPTLIVNLGVRL